MTKKEIIKECIEMMDNGADIIEIYEWVEDNTDVDPAEIISEVYKKQAFI